MQTSHIAQMIVLVSDLRGQKDCVAKAVLDNQKHKIDNCLVDNLINGKKSIIVWVVSEEKYAVYVKAQFKVCAYAESVIVEVLDASNDDYEWHQDIEGFIRFNSYFDVDSALEVVVPDALAGLPIWYCGIVADRSFCKSYGSTRYECNCTRLLPITHEGKLITWMALLAGSESYVGLPWGSSYFVDLVGVINTSKLLYQFDEASGNGCDDFDLESVFSDLELTIFDPLCNRPEILAKYEAMDASWDLLGGEVDKVMLRMYGVPDYLRRWFISSESLFYTLWYSCYKDYSVSTSDKVTSLFMGFGVDDFYIQEKVSSYEIIESVYE